jgi:hypothetical protein
VKPDQDILAISAVFKHLGLSHNDVTVPGKTRQVPVECVYAYCTCEWAGPNALVNTPWGLFIVTPTPDGFAVES